MRFGVSIIILAGLVFSGCAPVTLPNESLAPAFTQEEAMAKIGHRVRCIYANERYQGMKCPERGVCVRLRVGEHGIVAGMKEVFSKELLLSGSLG